MTGGDQDPGDLLPFFDDLIGLSEETLPHSLRPDTTLQEIHPELTPRRAAPSQQDQSLHQLMPPYSGNEQPDFTPFPTGYWSHMTQNDSLQPLQWEERTAQPGHQRPSHSPYRPSGPIHGDFRNFQPGLDPNMEAVRPAQNYEQRARLASPLFPALRPMQPPSALENSAHLPPPETFPSIRSPFEPAFGEFGSHLDQERLPAPVPEPPAHFRRTASSAQRMDPEGLATETPRRRGRPRLYDTSVSREGFSEDADAETSEPPRKSKRGAKPKYKYKTEAEAVANRRERNRKTAISSYYKRKNKTEELKQEIQDLEEEKKAMLLLMHALRTTTVDKGSVGHCLEQTKSGVQALGFLKQLECEANCQP